MENNLDDIVSNIHHWLYDIKRRRNEDSIETLTVNEVIEEGGFHNGTRLSGAGILRKTFKRNDREVI